MIQHLSNTYQKASATLLLTICFNGMILPLTVLSKGRSDTSSRYYSGSLRSFDKSKKAAIPLVNTAVDPVKKNPVNKAEPQKAATVNVTEHKPAIGGPSQPEMSAFKPVGTDNMVNLFSGDFSYNIPLLDVGGYPVNIFYDGGVSMEQEASWVGLGWNINPGNVNRNMRGVPDDFNGEDVLKQTQTIKPNVTWGVTLGADLELVGIKANPFSGSVGASLGVSFNNYLGPALDIGIRGSTGISVGSKADAEKSAPRLGASLSINASSRSGVTFSPAISLTANAFKTDKGATGGFGLRAGTSYNSKVGIKSIQISEQMSFNYNTLKFYEGKDGNTYYRERMSSIGANIASTSISFAKPSYVPTMRMPLTNSAWSGHFQLGGAIFGVAIDGEVEVFKQKSQVADADVNLTKPMVGYLYLQKANGNSNAVMDFTRLNDNEVTTSTPLISAPQYSYDVFSIQGEGTGGSIRAYRNDEGYVRDNLTSSKDKSLSFGGDIDIPGHYGGNFNIIKTPSTIGEWNAGNKLRTATGFKDISNSWENVYFRNPGESSVQNPNQYDRIGGTDLVRYKLGGSSMSPTIEPVLEKFSKNGIAAGIVNIPATAAVTERKKRTQVINFLNAEEASVIGLDKSIKSYDPASLLNAQGNLSFTSFPRFDNITRKKHHISQINVTEANGQRYIYGIPVYNIKQKDFTFTVNNAESAASPGKVDIDPSEATTLNTGNKDGYLQITETPAYAHSFLLSGLLSPDYIDLTGDGITEDDMGNAVKFNYSKMADISKWRTPLTTDAKANFNAGKLTETKDDKGIISYGERESWYLHSIESKTLIAVFKLEDRHDSKGSNSELSGINGSDNSAKRLKQIDLYSKSDLKEHGLQGARPIKTVHFEYSYNLCKNTPNNTTAGEGKLTLDKIYFTFNGQTRASKNQYVFSYGTTTAENPDYSFNASDRWGVYKPSSSNPQALKNSDYPYSIEDKNQKTVIDQNAGAWMLKKILLPSGGQMEVTYESDDYAFVQNKRAAIMMEVAGFGATNTSITNQLYTVNGDGITENNYAFLKVPEACNSAQELYRKYLDGIQQLSFKLAVDMPKGMEFLHSYATIDGNNYGVYSGDATNKTIWVKLNLVDNLSPLSLTAIEFLREQLPGQANPGYDVSESSGLAQIGDMFAGWWDGIKGAFKNPVGYLRGQSLAQSVDLSRCFVRLNDPDGIKYGGGYRVKTIKLKDNWKQMNSGQLFTSEYGQEYDYTTKEIFNGAERTISSGVASYEPSLGGDENPFQTMLQVSNKVPLGPASYGAIEMPVLDAFFPGASVGYSKITVKSIKKGVQDPTKKSRSGIGKQVTEFYTAKDFPVYYSNTSFDPSTDKQATSSSFGIFFYKYAFDSRALSQGFLVETNDMHGKMKSQASYPENDDKSPINYTQNFYRNTGSNGMNEKFDFVYASQSGTIGQGNMGIDVELMTDTREFSVKSKSLEIQAQLDLFPVIIPFWLPFIWPVAGSTENTYRAVTTTKVVTYHSILDSVVVIDKGSQVSTKNMIYDSETGDVIVNRTNNEFNKATYSTNYPAWWAYSGMGLAYKNIDVVYSGVNFRDGKITSGNVPATVFESGDELYLVNQGASPTDPCAQVLNLETAVKLWAFDKNKNSSSLTNTNPDYYFMDEKGRLYNKNGVSFRIVRSGKRNMLRTSAGSVVSMVAPIVSNKLKVDLNSKVISAAANEFKEKWQTDYNIFKRYSMQYPTGGPNLIVNNNFSAGFTGFGSSYTYSSASPSSAGKINVATNPNAWNPVFPNCGDHTSGSGNMLMADGSTIPGPTFAPVWTQTVSVTPNTNYTFSVWAKSLYSISPANISVSINASGLSPALQLTSTTCSWEKLTCSWNSGSNTSAFISMRSNSNVANGNDFALDDIYFGLGELSCNVQPGEIEDCNGYLEKNINPYVKGLLGTFRTQQGKVFYGSRKETDPVAATNISANGFLDNFKLYWDFNVSSNLVPDLANSKWVFNSQVTKFNSQGMELETKDALDIYTAAQYGFNKTMALAITNNSRNSEMAYVGFEDAWFYQTLNGAIMNACLEDQLGFTTMPNSAVTTTDGLGFNAHTGKYLLSVPATKTASKVFINKIDAGENYNLGFTSATANLNPVYQSGQLVSTVTTPPVYPAIPYTYYNQANTFETMYHIGSPGPANPYYPCVFNELFEFNQSGNIQISSDGSYALKVKLKTYGMFTGYCYNQSSNPIYWDIQFVLNNYTFKVYKDNQLISQYNGNSMVTESPGVSVIAMPSMQLCSGFYKIEVYINSSITTPYVLDCYNNTLTSTRAYRDMGIGLYVDNSTSTFANNVLVSSQPCTFTKPIVAKDSMINSLFNIPAGKKMIFSGWVRENCGSPTTPCTLQTYTNGKVNLVFNNGTTFSLLPSGPIVDGWQKIEGEFTAPAGYTSMSLNFVNSSPSQPAYFDDIRIHPYNANMKSYVYDRTNLRLVAELDPNNYASFYEYDEEGVLIRTKAETKEGIKTTSETRSAKQKNITTIQ